MIFWSVVAFVSGIILGLIIMAISYELFLYCKNKNKDLVIN